MRSDAQRKADKKYNEKRKTVHFGVSIQPEDYEFIDSYCKETGISKAKLAVLSIRYCIENDIELK